jgi:hypothetical protein
MSPIADCEVLAIRLAIAAALTAERWRGESTSSSRAASSTKFVHCWLVVCRPMQDRSAGLVYRQVMEMLRGVRGEAETRALIVQENRRYARRQLIWFRKEPNLKWFDGPGEREEFLRLRRRSARHAWMAEEMVLDGPGH